MLRLSCRSRGTRRLHVFFASRRRSPDLRLLCWTRLLANFALHLPLMLLPLRDLLRPSLRARPSGAPVSAALLQTSRWILPLWMLRLVTVLALVLCPDPLPALLDECLPGLPASSRRTRRARGHLGAQMTIPDAHLLVNKMAKLLFMVFPALRVLHRFPSRLWSLVLVPRARSC